MLLGDPTPASLSTDQTMVTISGSIQDEVVDVTGATVLDLSLMQPSKSAIRCKSRTANYEKAKRYQSAFQRTYITVTQTPFGKLVCMITRHGKCCSTFKHHDCDAEVETTYTFVPSCWVMKFGMAAFRLDLPEFSTQGWQAKIRAWNVYLPISLCIICVDFAYF